MTISIYTDDPDMAHVLSYFFNETACSVHARSELGSLPERSIAKECTETAYRHFPH